MAAEKNQSHIKHGLAQTLKEPKKSKDVHIVVAFAYLLSSYSKFEWAENTAVQACTKKLSGKQICCTTKWFL